PDSSSTITASTIIVSPAYTAPGPSASPTTPHFRGIPYLWPAIQGAADTALINDGTGKMSWQNTGPARPAIWTNSAGVIQPNGVGATNAIWISPVGGIA